MTEKRQIKKTVKDKEGVPLVIINVSYPHYVDGDAGEKKEETVFSRRFNAHYEKLSASFLSFGETDLKKSAASSCGSERFSPFGCVMSCIVSFEDEKYISVTFDISLTSGNIKRKKRLSQNWDKERGVVCSFADVFKKISPKQVMGYLCEDAEKRMEKRADTFYSDYKKRINKYFKKEDFMITPAGYGFIFPPLALNGKNVPVTLTFPRDIFSKGSVPHMGRLMPTEYSTVIRIPDKK